MKKVILGLLTAATAVSIVGCGGTSSDSAQANNSNIESTENIEESASWKTYDGPSATKEEWESDSFLTVIYKEKEGAPDKTDVPSKLD